MIESCGFLSLTDLKLSYFRESLFSSISNSSDCVCYQCNNDQDYLGCVSYSAIVLVVNAWMPCGYERSHKSGPINCGSHSGESVKPLGQLD